MGRLRDMARDAVLWHREVGDIFPVTNDIGGRWEGNPKAQVLFRWAYSAARAAGASPRAAQEAASSELAYLLISHAGWAQDGLNAFRLTDAEVASFIGIDVNLGRLPGLLPYRCQVLLLPDGWISIRGRPIRQFAAMGYTIPDGRYRLDVTMDIGGGACIFGNWYRGHEETAYDRAALDTIYETNEDEAIALMTAKRIVRGFYAWIATREPGRSVEKSTSSPGKKQRSRPKVWRFHTATTIEKSLVDAIKASVAVGRPIDRRLALQHIVRGHCKSQPHGPGMRDRKTIWVDPYWRGPDSEEAWARIYGTSDQGRQ